MKRIDLTNSPSRRGDSSAFTLAEHVTHCKNLRKAAFTLAEVLITLGIIGVVAAITLPTLIQQHQKQVYATGAKKGMNTIMNMMNKIQADENASDFTSTSLFTDGVCSLTYSSSGTFSGSENCEELYGNPTVLERIIPQYIKTVKICKNDDCKIEYTRSWFDNNKLTPASNDYENIYSINFSWATITGFYSADGIVYYVFPSEAGISFSYDINGEKGPNEVGRDLFTFSYCRNGKISYSYPVNTDCISYNTHLYTNNPLYHLMTNGWKMDY